MLAEARGSCRRLEAAVVMPVPGVEGGAGLRNLKWVRGEGEAVGQGTVQSSGAGQGLAGVGVPLLGMGLQSGGSPQA